MLQQGQHCAEQLAHTSCSRTACQSFPCRLLFAPKSITDVNTSQVCFSFVLCSVHSCQYWHIVIGLFFYDQSRGMSSVNSQLSIQKTTRISGKKTWDSTLNKYSRWQLPSYDSQMRAQCQTKTAQQLQESWVRHLSSPGCSRDAAGWTGKPWMHWKAATK